MADQRNIQSMPHGMHPGRKFDQRCQDMPTCDHVDVVSRLASPKHSRETCGWRVRVLQLSHRLVAVQPGCASGPVLHVLVIIIRCSHPLRFGQRLQEEAMQGAQDRVAGPGVAHPAL